MASSLFLESKRSVVNGDVLRLNFSGQLREGLQISPSRFEVYGDGRQIPVGEVSVSSSLGQVELTLARSVDMNDTVKVSYFDLSGDQNLNILEDVGGYDIDSFKKEEVMNETKPIEGLSVTLAEAFESTLTIGFDLEMDPESTPNNGMFRVKANGNSNRVTNVELFPNKREAVLTLAQPIAAGDTVTLNYVDARGDQTRNVIQDNYGNDLDTLTGFPVENLEDFDSFDPPAVQDSYIEDNIITLEFDEDIIGGKIRKSLFKVKANGKRQKIKSAIAVDDEGIVEITLRDEVPPAFDTITVDYRDIKGNQRRGVIQDMAGNDAESFRGVELDFFG
jgi:uncharacterized repeat protein (TIGR02059 family)